MFPERGLGHESVSTSGSPRTLDTSPQCGKGNEPPIWAPDFQSVSFKTSQVCTLWEPLKDSGVYPIEIDSVNAKH